MRNRWYEPRTGRFLSEDPIGLEGGINQYVYGRNDPVNRRDPLGEKLSCNGIVVIVDDVEVPCSEDLLGIVDAWLRGHHGLSLEDALRHGGSFSGDITDARRLSPQERALLGTLCNVRPDVCDAARIALYVGMNFGAITLGTTIFFHIKATITTSWLAHELHHVAQYLDWGAVKYYATALYMHTIGRIFHGSPYSLEGFSVDRPLSRYRMEQQAEIVRLCYLVGGHYCRVSPYHP